MHIYKNISPKRSLFLSFSIPMKVCWHMGAYLDIYIYAYTHTYINCTTIYTYNIHTYTTHKGAYMYIWCVGMYTHTYIHVL